ncbi:hypothetical protein D3C79_966150 [compost metagenome]
MDIGNQRYADLLLDLAKGFGRVHVRYRDTNNIDAGINQAVDLRHSGGDVIGVGVGHALYGDGGIAADRNITYPDFSRFATFDR